ncbi:hypothetical protein A6J76_007635 [Aggregatibacter aphrophilus]|uniref:hypothetical protein n=1 Tax=Aggregatibacter aphrophilus TaxID=732 RepID=UPI0009F53257|nr:hypothetical protein [Aggregatibacter aphrophilus]DAJ35356.1 MAG TPA: hypothetical protein [Caudoviricetes sp.]PNL88269.1 hypothetical protein A6J76_011615 [Aggregatibacter aphrophilus]PNL88272.1 hypothetical protein A6J76_011635 [Aggregatibacter aphrophilus]PNL89892.1 hypothetical protein A6J76_011460 [Aggregatibacter aphrophilus]PNL93764.1 hypothetical protein A6J76_007355 [Aggregatibacter aphrophilus]
MGTIFIWIMKMIAIFVVAPILALYVLGSILSDGFAWGGFRYIAIIVAVSVVFGLIEWFKPSNS